MSISAKREPAAPAMRPSGILNAVALSIVAVLPAMMTLASRSAPAVVTAAAILAAAAALAAGGRERLVGDANALLRGPMGAIAGTFIAAALLSLLWSGHKALSMFALGEALLPVITVFVLVLTIHAPLPRWFISLAILALGLAAVDIVLELSTGLAVRHALGVDAQAYGFNRSVITLLILYWPLAVILVGEGLGKVALGLGVLLLVAVLLARSGAAMLGLAVAMLIYLLTLAARRLAFAIVAALLVVAFVTAPLKGDIAAALLPDRFLALLAPAHARDRVEIWQSFGEVVRRRPLVGTGFGTSVALASDPVAAQVPPERRVLLGVGHPHDGFLQIWTELGLLGAVLAAGLGYLVMRDLRRLPAKELAPRLACLAAAIAIASVGHGVWQGWWIAILGIAILLFRVSGEHLEAGNHHGRP